MSFVRESDRVDGPDLRPVAEVVSERVWRAMLDASEKLNQLGVRHALAGGLAVGAHGWPRATHDVDFLVGDSAWDRTESGLVTARVGLPVQWHGVAIDTLSIRDDERHLVEVLERAVVSEGVPVIPIEALVYLKLVSPRPKDRLDLHELVRRGIDVELVRGYLDRHRPALRARFDGIVAEAAACEG